MKQMIGMCSLCICLAAGVRARSTTLPDSCGNDKTQFDVKTEKNAPAPALPGEGKAQIIFFEQVDATAEGGCIGCNYFASRIGIDGSWVGAVKGGSYSAVEVAPGEHHLCTYWKSISATRGKNIAVAPFNAEAGKVYYFQVTIRDIEGGVSGPSHRPVTSAPHWVLDLKPVNEDEGRYGVKIAALAISTQKGK